MLINQCKNKTFFFPAPASYAQTRIWSDEQNRLSSDKSQIALHNMPFLYRLNPNQTLSVKQLHQALQLILIKHQSLRTALSFNTQNNLLMQRVAPFNNNNNQLFSFIQSTFKTDEQLNQIIYNEQSDAQLFDLSEGVVFRCHIVYYNEISSDHLISDKDVIIFNFHHALFDIPSMNTFLHDLNQAYSTGQLTTDDDDDTTLRYLDCEYLNRPLLLVYRSFIVSLSYFLFRCSHRTTNANDCSKHVLA